MSDDEIERRDAERLTQWAMNWGKFTTEEELKTYQWSWVDVQTMLQEQHEAGRESMLEELDTRRAQLKMAREQFEMVSMDCGAERTRSAKLIEALREIAKRTEITYGVERPTSEAKIALDVLSKFGD